MKMKEHLNEAVYQAKRSLIREFSRYARETEGCIALTLGEPDFDTPASISDTLAQAIDASETHYIANNGSYELCQKIAAFERKHNGMDYAPEEVIVTVGATEGLFTALMGILNPGDEVIIPQPAFSLYEEIVGLCRGKVIRYDCSEDGFQIRYEKLNALINEKTKAIILNSPNNPTGCILDELSLKAVHDCVANKPIFVICDDVYRQLVYTDGYHSFTEYKDLREQIILIQSYSKPYAMTGWRIGYMCMDSSIKERLELIHQYCVVSTPSLFQRAGISALEHDPSNMRKTYEKRRKYMLDRLADIGMEVSVPQGAFYVFPSIEKYGLSSEEFCMRMIKEAGLAATPGTAFGCDGFIRLTYCYNDAQLKEGMDRLERFVHRLEKENDGHDGLAV